MVGDTVRCPWHHACFSLRTGEAFRAPALSPVACWKVERRGAKVVVTDKVERDPLAPATKPTIASAGAAENLSVVIVGAGAAGSAAAEMLRRSGHRGSITIVDADQGSPYDRPNLSKDYLAGNAPEEWIPLRPDGFYSGHKIDIVRGRATNVDTKARRVEIEGRAPLAYDALLLATGAEPIHLQVPGDDLPHVHFLRTLDDSRSIIEVAKKAKRAVVIGASFIGLEVAASLRARDIEVHVAAPETLPLARVLGDHLGAFIKSLHEEKGVVFHLGRRAKKVERDAVVLDDGTRVAADLVVFGVGVRPRLDLAERAGLRVDKGVIVNVFGNERAWRVRRRRHREVARSTHGAVDSRRALGSSAAPGAGGGAQHPRRGGEVHSGAVLLERTLRREHQLHRPRREVGQSGGGWRRRSAGRRSALRERREAARAGDVVAR